ncbi:hypothetical protein [Sinomonas atrocyanea]
MKTARLLCAIGASVMLAGCTGPGTTALPQGPSPSAAAASAQPAAAAVVSPSPVPFPAGSAVCNDSLTDSNPLNIATAKLSSDGRTLSVLITLDSPYPVHTGRAFKITMGTVQHQTDYVAEIDENGSGAPTVSVTDGRTGNATPVPDAAATITDQKVTARIPTADLPAWADTSSGRPRPPPAGRTSTHAPTRTAPVSASGSTSPEPEPGAEPSRPPPSPCGVPPMSSAQSSWTSACEQAVLPYRARPSPAGPRHGGPLHVFRRSHGSAAVEDAGFDPVVQCGTLEAILTGRT